MILTHGANSIKRGGGPIGDLFHYKTNFKNFDISTMTDYPLEGSPITYTPTGTGNYQLTQDGLLCSNTGDFTFAKQIDSFDYSEAKRIVVKSRWKVTDATLDNLQWAWNGINYLNCYLSRGQGLWMVKKNLVTDYIIKFDETHLNVNESFAVPINNNIFLNEEVEAIVEWNYDGTMQYRYRGEEAGSNTGITGTNIVRRLAYLWFGTYYASHVLTGYEVDVFG